jgi:hypothetical protein
MNLIKVGLDIYQSEISVSFHKFLLDQYEHHLEEYTQLYQNENYWGGKDFEFVKPEFKDYLQEQLQRHVREYIGNNNLKLFKQWINIQAHDGFLPVHDHYGFLSYVIYLKVPPYRENYENKKMNQIGYVEGAIQFHYGYPTSMSSPFTLVHPTERMILIFPAELMHYVYPFKDSSSLRISISGNFVKE